MSDLNFYSTSERGADYCDQLVCRSVCLSVCVFVCPRPCRWTDLREICCADFLRPWFGSPLAASWYVMYFRFYGWRHIWPYWVVWRFV